MLPNEEFALACRAYYGEQGLIVDETNGEFAHCPLPKGMGEEGYYLLHEHHQHQGLLQSRDIGRRCFYTFFTRNWLLTADYFPDNFFELWDIYDEFTSDVSQLNTPDAVRRRVETRLENYRKNPESRLARSETQKKVWEGRTVEERERLKNIRQKACAEAGKRGVEIVFPDGRIGRFSSVKLAASYLGIHQSTLCHWLKGRKMPKNKQPSYSFSYV